MCDSSNNKTMWQKLGNKMLRSNSLIFTYIRSIVSSQCAGWIDMLLGFIFFAWFDFSPLTATMIGAFCGGVVNCVLNYSFTFRANGVDWRAVIVKYTLVWIGSMLLNSYGTGAIYNLISNWHWLENLGFKPDGYFAVARLFTSLMVSWFWNFVLQRYFVYRSVWLDTPIVRAMDAVGIKNKKNNGNNGY